METLIDWITRKTFFCCSYCCEILLCWIWPKILTCGVSAEWGVFVSCACPRVHLGCSPLFPVLTWLHARALKGAPVPVATDIPDIDQSCRENLHQLWSSSVQRSPVKCCSSLGPDVWEICSAPFSLRVACHSGTVNLCWWHDCTSFAFGMIVGMCYLCQALYQTHGPPLALEFMPSCWGRK